MAGDSRPDATAQAELSAPVNEPAYVAYLDILGDPVRVTTAPYSVTFSGTGDEYLDGETFVAQDGSLIDVSPVEQKEGGGATVTVSLSGLIDIDGDTLNLIGDKANWQGRYAKLWTMMIDPSGVRVGNIWCYHAGYMTVPKIVGDQDSQTIVMSIEGWLSFMSQASGRTWLAQSRYDPDDHSPEAAIAVANGTKGNALVDTARRDEFVSNRILARLFKDYL